MKRFAVAGFQHETNTFAESRAGWADFVAAGSWPGMKVGEEVRSLGGANIPISGAMAEIEALGHEVVPLAWCAANSSGFILDVAFERICRLMVAQLKGAVDRSKLDGLYLDLHGAAVTESSDEPEADLIYRLRAVAPNAFPVAISLDLHANAGDALVDAADFVVAYRTYPHLDMADTGRRAVRGLVSLAGGARFHKVRLPIPFLLPEVFASTLADPTKAIFAQLSRLEAKTSATLSFCPGFPLADVPHCGPTILAFAPDKMAAHDAASDLARLVLDSEADFPVPVWAPADAVAEAIRLCGDAAGSIVMADVQDNPGGGGDGNTTGLLSALLDGNASAVSALHCEPEIVATACRVGVGHEFDAVFGLPLSPLALRVRVEALASGPVAATSPVYAGGCLEPGRSALLRVRDGSGVRLIASERNVQAADRGIFLNLGVKPEREAIVALKSQVYFRADFDAIASATLLVAAPGRVVVDTASLPWKRLRAGVRLAPAGPIWRPPRTGQAPLSPSTETSPSLAACPSSFLEPDRSHT